MNICTNMFCFYILSFARLNKYELLSRCVSFIVVAG